MGTPSFKYSHGQESLEGVLKSKLMKSRSLHFVPWLAGPRPLLLRSGRCWVLCGSSRHTDLEKGQGPAAQGCTHWPLLGLYWVDSFFLNRFMLPQYPVSCLLEGILPLGHRPRYLVGWRATSASSDPSFSALFGSMESCIKHHNHSILKPRDKLQAKTKKPEWSRGEGSEVAAWIVLGLWVVAMASSTSC